MGASAGGFPTMPRYLFVTGRLAAQSLRDCLNGIAELEFALSVLPISVAALMDAKFVAKHLADAMECEKVMVPGSCSGDIQMIADKIGVEVIRGPKSLKDIPAFFGETHTLEGYGEYHAKILAEIVDAHIMGLDEILQRAEYFRASGGDIIDLGCPVNGAFPGIGKVVRTLKEKGFLVSVDSFDPEIILQADQAGADFILSVNSRNIELAPHLRGKVVVIPDFDGGLDSLEHNIARLEEVHVPYIIDPVLKPISFGFTESVDHFIQMRRRHPAAEMMMGLGNVTELIDADSTGVNAIMAGIATELQIDYVLTTEVISWARGAVREFDLARQLMYYAHKNRLLPKHLNDSLITVKDPPFVTFAESELREMQTKLKDPHYRIFTDREFIYVFNNKVFVRDTDIATIFDRLSVDTVAHAFYLGRELQKAFLAVKLGKRYVQEDELRWGYLS
jgi:dihydropteroate synthase-like protein